MYLNLKVLKWAVGKIAKKKKWSQISYEKLPPK